MILPDSKTASKPFTVPLLTLVMSTLVILSACGPAALPQEGGTLAADSLTPTHTLMPVCTPPPCTENESYHCPDACIGGCGTVCATHTPSAPTEEADVATAEGELPGSVQVFPDPAGYQWVPVVTGLEKPLYLTHTGDGSGRLFVLEQPGLVRVVQGGELLPDPFLDIRKRVDDGGNEQGLLGLAFHPHYSQNGAFFVNYTGKGGDTFISRFSVSADPNLADPASETLLLRIAQPYANHNGGHLVFGPDGYLYIGTGDGGSGGDPQGNAQNPDSLLGKMLRIDVDHGDPYAIPADNPYAFGGGRPEIWAAGLRNPWRYAFDRATGDLYLADVGQNQWEEVNFTTADQYGVPPAGGNYGWDYWEATHPFEGEPPAGVEVISPIWEYDHAQGCSITGGYVYRGLYPELRGVYFYGDFCSGAVWGLLRDSTGEWRNALLFQTGANITSFGEGENGELYLVTREGVVYQLVETW